jgi:hypothetical protein
VDDGWETTNPGAPGRMRDIGAANERLTQPNSVRVSSVLNPWLVRVARTFGVWGIVFPHFFGRTRRYTYLKSALKLLFLIFLTSDI